MNGEYCNHEALWIGKRPARQGSLVRLLMQRTLVAADDKTAYWIDPSSFEGPRMLHTWLHESSVRPRTVLLIAVMVLGDRIIQIDVGQVSVA